MSERMEPEIEQLASACIGPDGQFVVNRKMAEWIVSMGNWSKGGYRVCVKCNKEQRVSAEQITEWLGSTGSPRCLICTRKTELFTTEEWERMR